MSTDVIVVGAGPTGLMLACELALAGVRTRVLERRTEPQRDSRALSLHPRSVELMDQRGLLDRFLPLGRAVPGWHFAGLRTQLDFSALDSRHGYTLFLAQARTEAILERRAHELGWRSAGATRSSACARTATASRWRYAHPAAAPRPRTASTRSGATAGAASCGRPRGSASPAPTRP